ncbi:MAG: hypothetical protein JWM80_1475 [Cyanobacteria bacterium RYN_339]|nr:hypothetical protein [Cyanobacteria bacterium RYN_339]
MYPGDVKRLALVVASLLLAAPAYASVDDPLGLLGADVDKAVDVGMKNINADRLDVVILRALPGDVAGMARLRFGEKHLGPDAGVIMVGTESHQIGTYLGADYAAHGVTPGVVQRLIERVYLPEAKKGNTSDAILALVNELKLARTLGRDPAITPLAPPPKLELPWWWYLPPTVFIVLGLLVRFGMKLLRSRRRRARLRAVVDRLEDLQWQLKRLEPAVAKLREAEVPGTAHAALDERTAEADRELADLHALHRRTGEALKHGDWEGAETQLADADRRLFPLAASLAANLAGHRARLAGEDVAALLTRSDATLARWQRLSEARARWDVTTQAAARTQLGERLESLARVLSTAPLDVQGAEDYLDATEAIFGRALEATGMSSR